MPLLGLELMAPILSQLLASMYARVFVGSQVSR